MKKRNLGQQGLKVSELGLGCMGMSWAYGSADEKEAIATIHRALEIGIDFLDTAEIYGPFKNEELIGKAIKGKRDQYVIASKFGFKFENNQMAGLNSSPENVRRATEGSLKRLGVDHIDLLYQHRVDPQVPIEETVGAMAQLIKEGKVRFLGLSEAGIETISRAHKIHPISALQSEYSLWERNLEPEIIPAIREMHIGLVPFSPVGRGFLTGQIKTFDDLPADDYRRNDPRYQGENFKMNLRLVDKVRAIAQQKGATPAQIALAWLLLKGDDVVPIPGTKRRAFLEENAAATEISLSPHDLQELEDIASSTSGDRYNERGMATIDR